MLAFLRKASRVKIEEAPMIKDALFTDFYELTMAQGFWKKKKNSPVVFDMFFRKQPFNGGFSVFAGLEPLLNAVQDFSFSCSDIAFLKSTGMFEDAFLEFLGAFRFSGDIWAMEEGSVIFPNEPLLRVHGNIIECALLEGLILNTINFQSLVATKTARIWLASKKGAIMEFGLRRAQGCDGAMSASRAAFIGGASGTSNTLAGKVFGIPVMGTLAHSWVMSFPTEEEAFDAYAEIYPQNTCFLLDTYDTLGSGIKAAIASGKKLIKCGYNFSVRLDSGDMEYLSSKVRKALDDEGLNEAKITVSNELTEEIIASLVNNRAPIDSWGVGTHLVTGGSNPSFGGVYKLAAKACGSASGELTPVMKVSDNPDKTTNPGVKQVWRLYNADGTFKADILAKEDEAVAQGEPRTYYHPSNDWQSFSFAAATVEPLLKLKMKGGNRVESEKSIQESRHHMEESLCLLDGSYKRILNPHIYKVSLTEALRAEKLKILKSFRRN